MLPDRKPRGRGRPRKNPPQQLTAEQMEAMAETAFLAGQFFMDGLIYAFQKYQQKRSQELAPPAPGETPPTSPLP